MQSFIILSGLAAIAAAQIPNLPIIGDLPIPTTLATAIIPSNGLLPTDAADLPIVPTDLPSLPTDIPTDVVTDLPLSTPSGLPAFSDFFPDGFPEGFPTGFPFPSAAIPTGALPTGIEPQQPVFTGLVTTITIPEIIVPAVTPFFDGISIPARTIEVPAFPTL